MKRNVLYILLNLCFLAISLRKVAMLEGLCIGRHWDWNLPCIIDNSGAYTAYDKYVWIPTNLGDAGSLGLTQIASKIIIGSLINIDGQLFGVTLIFAILTSLSFLFMAKIVERNSGLLAGITTGLLYTYSPYIFNEIVGGSIFLWIGYYLIPPFLFESINFINTKKGGCVHLTLLLILQLFITSTIHFAFFSNLIFAGLLFYRVYSTRSIQPIKRGFVYVTGYFLTNIYWIFPFVHFLTDFTKINFPKAVFTAKKLADVKQTVITIPSMMGYADRNIYFYALNRVQTIIATLAVLCFWVLVILRQLKAPGRKIGILLLLFGVSLILIKGGNRPFPGLTESVFMNFTPMKLFRSPQRLMFLASFLVPLIFAASQDKPTNKRYSILMLLIVLGWTSGWWANGDLGMSNLQRLQKDSINTYEMEGRFSDLLKDYRSSENSGRILFLPADMSPFYLKTRYQGYTQGSEGEYYTMDKTTTFWSEGNTFLNPINEYFCKHKEFDFIGFLSLFGVKEIILRKDLTPAHTVCTPFNSKKWKPEIAKNSLEANTRLKKIEEGESFVRYEIAEENVNSKFYIPTKVVRLNAYEDLFTLDKIDIGVAYTTDYLSEIEEAHGYTISSYEYVNPTEYRLKIDSDKSKTGGSVIPLVFLETYHRDWNIVNTAVDTTHLTINKYANLWLIDIDEYCDQNAHKCEGNEIELIIKFSAQELADKSLSISLYIAGLVILAALGELVKGMVYKSKDSV